VRGSANGVQLARVTAARFHAEEEQEEAAEREAALAALTARLGWRLKPRSLRGITVVQVSVHSRTTHSFDWDFSRAQKQQWKSQNPTVLFTPLTVIWLEQSDIGRGANCRCWRTSRCCTRSCGSAKPRWGCCFVSS
jgi:hypothetical protein